MEKIIQKNLKLGPLSERKNFILSLFRSIFRKILQKLTRSMSFYFCFIPFQKIKNNFPIYIYIYLYTRGFHSIRSVLYSKINIRRLKLPLILPFYFFILITYIKKKKKTKFRQNLEANRFIDNNIANNRFQIIVMLWPIPPLLLSSLFPFSSV